MKNKIIFKSGHKKRVLEGNDIKVYQRGVGMLQWLCLNTRPDIAFATNTGIKASAPTERLQDVDTLY